MLLEAPRDSDGATRIFLMTVLDGLRCTPCVRFEQDNVRTEAVFRLPAPTAMLKPCRNAEVKLRSFLCATRKPLKAGPRPLHLS